MTEGAFGPQGKRIERPSHEEEVDRFTRAFGFEPEPKYEPEEIPPESSWGDADRKNMFAEYFKRHPGARPKPTRRELTKFETTKIAPNTTVAEYLPGLLDKLRTVLENYAIFEEKVAAFERKQLDECTSRGPEYQWIDGNCLRLNVTGDGANPENAPAQKSFTKSSPSIDAVSGMPFCYDLKHMNKRHIHETRN